MVQMYIYIIYTLESLNTDNTPINFTFMHMCKLETKPFEHTCSGSYLYQVGFYGAYPNLNK